MNVDMVVNSTPVYPGPTETHQFGVYASNPNQLGLVVRRGFGDAADKALTSANADRSTPIISTTHH
jgi:hypothetical protein